MWTANLATHQKPKPKTNMYDLIVIGGGPAGYVGAIRAAQLGKKVACVEMDRAGGTCLNWGCIPTKAILKNAELYQTLTHKAKEFGITFDNLQYDWSAVIGRSRKVSSRLAGGIEFLFKKNKVDYIRGFGSIPAPNKVEVKDAEGNIQTLEAKNILVSTGCKSRELPPLPFNGKSVISSKEAMNLPVQPKDMLIIGAGAIGVDLARK
jgi:dihydrolipoamide dehydrogenase